jgi:histone H3/H4
MKRNLFKSIEYCMIMPRPGTIIPKAPIAKIMQNSGAKRVSEDAVDVLVDYLIDYSTQLSERAIKIAKHSGRKTVQGGDIKIAVK